MQEITMPRPDRARCRFLPALSLALLLAAGCGEDARTPTAPELEPALAVKPARALAFRQVSAGWVHACGVTLDNQAYCWASNFAGQLGDGTTTDRLTPVPVAGGLQFRQVSAGFSYTCGVTVDDLAYCWGKNDEGKLGDGTITTSLTPVPVAGGLRFRQVSTGSFHTCGVTTDDLGYCWGGGAAGRGDEIGGEQRYRPFPVGPGLRFRELSAALVSSALGQFTCGVTLDDVAYCWGDNDFGELGIGSIGGHTWAPLPVAGGLAFRQINAGATRACGVTPDRLAYCWGVNWYGDVGDGTADIIRPAPVPVAGGLRFRDLSDGGEYHNCGLTLPGRAYCWGRNSLGQLGDGTTTDSPVPVPVAAKLHFSQLATGTDYTCGVARGHVAYCWGANNGGQLGNGTTTQSLTPVPVAAPAS
jgi:alpha-tubulin suppressor-like RCC1 family protein